MVVALTKIQLPDLHRLRSLLAMYALHGLNLAVPMVTIPIITRTLGPSEYGRYGVLINSAGIGVILIEFGMGVAATKQVSGKGDGEARGVLANVLERQTLNALFVLPLLGLGALLWLQPAPDLSALALTLVSAWSLGLNTLWFRVARANVPRLLPATLIAKLLSLLIVVVLLPMRPTLTVAMWANLASSFWPVIDAWNARHELMGALRSVSWRSWRESLKVSFPVPLQRFGSATYQLLPAILVANYFGAKVAGWYVLSERMVRAGVGLFQPLTSTLFPLQLEVRGLPKAAPARLRLRRYLIGTIGLALFASVFTFAFAGPAVRLFGGDKFEPAAVFLRWMAPSITLVTVNMALTSQLYVLDREPVIAHAVWASSALFTAAILLFGDRSPDVFAACCMLVEAPVGIWLLIASWVYAKSPRPAAAQPSYPGPQQDASGSSE